MRRAGPIALLTVVAACGGAEVKGQTSAVDELIHTARENGAKRCAPVELAMAESHNAFAKQDHDEGNYYRAREEARIAEENARLAVEKSPPAKCAPKVVVAEKPKKLVVTAKDSDGDGLNDDVDECPQKPEDFDGFQDEDGCPDLDNDADGLNDEVDECPMDPEDKDGFEDEDGCPDLDNDADGLADKVDQCPDKAEDPDGHEDDDGCPDCDNDGDGVLECPDAIDQCPDEPAETPDGCPQKYKLIVVTEKKIELKQTVYFATAKAKIRPRSFEMLNEVGQALEDNPKIRVRIEGHTDSQGGDRYNERLSDRRAKAVRRYLIDRGVSKDRMVAKGYGERQPIADNRTKAGRQMNRRVEFVIISR